MKEQRTSRSEREQEQEVKEVLVKEIKRISNNKWSSNIYHSEHIYYDDPQQANHILMAKPAWLHAICTFPIPTSCADTLYTVKSLCCECAGLQWAVSLLLVSLFLFISFSFLRTRFPFLKWNLRANISPINVCALLCFVFDRRSMTANGMQFYEDELAMNPRT